MTDDYEEIRIDRVRSASLIQFRQMAERLGFTEAQIQSCGNDIDALKTLMETHPLSPR